jgi:hypothetical protein
VLSQYAVRPSPQGNQRRYEALGPHFLNCPPAATARKLSINQRQMGSVRSGGFESRLISGCFGHDLKTVEGAQYRDESLAYLI